MSALGKKSGIQLLQSFLDSRGLDSSMVDEQQQGGLLDAVICVAYYGIGLESPPVIGDRDFNQFSSDCNTMNLSDTVDYGSLCWNGNGSA